MQKVPTNECVLSSRLLTPVHPVLQSIPRINAASTGRGISVQNKYFSFHRPGKDDDETKQCFNQNIRTLEKAVGLGVGRPVALPNGGWPHTGKSIKVEDYAWAADERCPRTVVPVDSNGDKVIYDAVATRSTDYAIAAQGADCPSVILADPIGNVIGIAHSGWKPLVRGVLGSLVGDMVDLGARPERISAFITAGAGDRYNCFQWDGEMEDSVRRVFLDAGRQDLLKDRSIRHELTAGEADELKGLGRGMVTRETFMLSKLARRQLVELGLSENQIQASEESTMTTRYADGCGFMYHSYRREKPDHGLSISIIFQT